MWIALLICGAGTAFQILPRGCLDYTVVQLVQAFNVCSVINCSGGTFFNFCPPNSQGFFADCPRPLTGVQTEQSTGTGTGTGTTGLTTGQRP
jgi:hypothetical protein